MKRCPVIVFVGAHRESEAPLRFLVEAGENVRGVVTLERERLATLSGALDVEPIAAAASIPVRRVANVNAPECVEWIQALEPDVLLVVGWTQLIRDELLAVPRVATIGFHASLLPRYRGRAPVNWALINGETETGNTMMVLSPGADEGDIVAQRRIPITDDDDCATLYDKVAATEVDMLAEVLPSLRLGRIARRPQEHEHATVMPKRRPEDGVIDWARSNAQLVNWVRALTHPYPGAFTTVDGRRLFVWKASAIAGQEPVPATVPGTVVAGGEDGPVVCTGAGRLQLDRVQLDGDDERAGRDVVRLLPVGTVLGAASGSR